MQLCWSNSWYQGKIISKTEESCVFAYDGYGPEWHTKVTPQNWTLLSWWQLPWWKEVVRRFQGGEAEVNRNKEKGGNKGRKKKPRGRGRKK
jgi:hypothetical protein